MDLLNNFMYLGIIAAGISGALVGIKKELDLFGVISIGAAASLGGGIIRDLMIGNTPPVALVDPSYFTVSLIAILVTWFFYKKINKLNKVILITDAIGLGVFTAIGSNTAIIHNYTDPFIVVSMGLITGIGGGVLRDLFANEIPFVFRKEIYAIASILGSISFIISYGEVPHIASLYICLTVTFLIRIIAILFKLNFPVIKNEVKLKEEN